MDCADISDTAAPRHLAGRAIRTLVTFLATSLCGIHRGLLFFYSAVVCYTDIMDIEQFPSSSEQKQTLTKTTAPMTVAVKVLVTVIVLGAVAGGIYAAVVLSQ